MSFNIGWLNDPLGPFTVTTPFVSCFTLVIYLSNELEQLKKCIKKEKKLNFEKIKI